MRHVIIGTAGHVDHGKTCLIRGLTGIDTDRLKEEKERGITIELGFAYLDLPGGQRAGIVDVPGHEKFVKKMLAGAGGMDMAMLVIAADEGIKPQTVEHLDILSILGVKAGTVVITKTDLAEEDTLEQVKTDVKELVKGTFLENAPVVPVSVYKGQGLDALKNILYGICSSLPEKKETGCFRLPIDRVFTLKGIGTIATGTLLDGMLEKGREAVVYPKESPVKIRGIQVHGAARENAWPGERTAVNIPDKKKEELLRGSVLAPEGSLYPSYMLDVKVSVLRHSKRKIRNGSRLHVYHGTSELLGKLYLMDREELLPGEACYGQLRLEDLTAAKRGDPFVLRFYSPAETIGGGVILDASPQKKKRKDPNVLEAFRIKEKGNKEELLALFLLENRGRSCTLEQIAVKCGLAYADARKAADILCREKCIFPLTDQRYIHREELEVYRKKADAFLEEFHRQHPLKEGMKPEEARSRLGVSDTRTADRILAFLKEQGMLQIKDGSVRKNGFQPSAGGEEGAIMEEILRDYREAAYAPLTTALYGEKYSRRKKFRPVFLSLIKKGLLIRLNDQYCIHKEHYENARETLRNMAEKQPFVETAAYRDALGCSRKMAISILEYFDKTGFTKRTEQGRILQKDPL